jgi:hydrogenase nickel incorporation protein HypA/HybF
MHELSLAQNIVDIVQQHVPADQAKSVATIKLRIGQMSGVVADSLDFCFSAITSATPLSSARLRIEHIPFTLRCSTCNNSFTSEFGTVLCPTCGSENTEVIGGTEMQIVEIELRDEPDG